MPIGRRNIGKVLRVMRAKVRNGLAFTALKGSELYKEAVSRVTEPNYPVGPFPGPHSSAGEYPYRETGQGYESIDYAKGPDRAAFGIKGSRGKRGGGMHLIWLTGKGRLGPINIVQDNKPELRREFMAGADATR